MVDCDLAQIGLRSSRSWLHSLLSTALVTVFKFITASSTNTFTHALYELPAYMS